jgi:hypothetical protein
VIRCPFFCGFVIAGMSDGLAGAGAAFKYRMFINILDRGSIGRLALGLRVEGD